MANGTPTLGQSILSSTGQPLPTEPIAPGGSNVPTRAEEISAFFKKPEVQAALIQAGATLLSPQVGESSVGNFGRAVSEGAAAGGRVAGERQRREESTAGRELASRQVAASESQAGTSQQIADQQVTLAREQMAAAASNLATRLAAEFDIALVGNELKLLTELARGEIENAFLNGREVNMENILNQFATARAAVGSKTLPIAPGATPLPGASTVPPGGTGAPSSPETPQTGTLPGVPPHIANITDEQVEALRRSAPDVNFITDEFIRRMFASETGEFLLRKVYGDEQVDAWKARVIN